MNLYYSWQLKREDTDNLFPVVNSELACIRGGLGFSVWADPVTAPLALGGRFDAAFSKHEKSSTIDGRVFQS